jgi:hypothetical protein
LKVGKSRSSSELGELDKLDNELMSVLADAAIGNLIPSLILTHSDRATLMRSRWGVIVLLEVIREKIAEFGAANAIS